MTLVLDIIAAALGLPTVSRKTARLTDAMVVLGMKVTFVLGAQIHDRVIVLGKCKHLEDDHAGGFEDRVIASPMAEHMMGRLNWTTSAILNRLGRAQIKPLYAQVMSPLKGGQDLSMAPPSTALVVRLH